MAENHLVWQGNQIFKNGKRIFKNEGSNLLDFMTAVYQNKKINYPKYFKMDILSKVAFLAAELMEIDDAHLEKDNVAVVLSTSIGCLDVDKKFEQSRQTHASPALFVYTLPNIMLGEICIRHGFKGEQLCSFEEQFRKEWFDFYVSDLLNHRKTDACLFGHIDATEDEIEVELYWKRKE